MNIQDKVKKGCFFETCILVSGKESETCILDSGKDDPRSWNYILVHDSWIQTNPYKLFFSSNDVIYPTRSRASLAFLSLNSDQVIWNIALSKCFGIGTGKIIRNKRYENVDLLFGGYIDR